MAESAVSFFLNNLSTLLIQESRFLLGVEDEIKSLQYKLQLIRSVLRDADASRRKNERTQVWVSQIRDVAYDAEDAIEMFLFKVSRGGAMGSIRRYVGCISQLPTIHRVRKQIEAINRRLQEISKSKDEFEISIDSAKEFSEPSNKLVSKKERRASIQEELDVVGFEKEVDDLKQLLERGDHELIISIVGMGGLGKTTLARKIYNRMNVKEWFESCAWINVSKEFSVKIVLQSIIKQVKLSHEEERKMFKGNTYPEELDLGEKTEEELSMMLKEHLKQRTYLIVLDDVWKKEDWDMLKGALMVKPNEGKKSRVLLTTRNEEVAKHADSSINPYHLRFLEEAESWELFLKVVFQGKGLKTPMSKELEDEGKKIVKKCGNLPLAIVVLGGLLSTKEKTVIVWKKVQESANWHLAHDSNPCLPILALSYDDLPYYLKSCFLYIGLFPEDYTIDARRLILKWVAEGFIEQRDKETMEDVGQDYLEELTLRSMIQVEKRNYGRIIGCRIHDLLRELAISEAKNDKFLDILGRNNLVSPNKPRRLAIHQNENGSADLNNTCDLRGLRSLLCFPQNLEKDLWDNLSKRLKLLRVLELSFTNIKSLPDEIGDFIFLKYLGLQRTEIRSLPHSICKLRNLQSLDLFNTRIRGIPSVIWRLHKLRHFRLSNIDGDDNIGDFIYEVCCCNFNVFIPCLVCRPQIDRLRDLQSLDLPAGYWIEDSLHKLVNLRYLRIRGHLYLHKNAISESIGKLDRLQLLYLVETGGSASLPLVSLSRHVHLYALRFSGRLEKLLDHHEFPQNLTSLFLGMSGLKQEDEPMKIFEKLPNLTELALYHKSFMGTQMTFSAQGFPKLKILRLSSLLNLQEWIVEEGTMPNLCELEIRHCDNLKMLPDGLKHISTLQKLQLYMPENFKSRVEKSTGEDWNKIQHVPTLLFNFD